MQYSKMFRVKPGSKVDLGQVDAGFTDTGRCSTEHAPWFIIPANHKWFRNLAIVRIVAETLETLHMRFPESTVDIAEIKKKYHRLVEAESIDSADPDLSGGRLTAPVSLQGSIYSFQEVSKQHAANISSNIA